MVHTCCRACFGLLMDRSWAVGSCKKAIANNEIDTKNSGTGRIETHLSTASMELWQKLTQVKYVLLKLKHVH